MKTVRSKQPPDQRTDDGLIVFVQDKKPLLGKPAALHKELADRIQRTTFSGDTAQVCILQGVRNARAENLILAGLGQRAEFHREHLERTAAAAVRAGLRQGMRRFAVSAEDLPGDIDGAAFLRLTARGGAWGAYRFDTFKSDRKKRRAEPTLALSGSTRQTAAGRRALDEAAIESAALTATADLANLPGNQASPATLAAWAKKTARAHGLSCSVLGGAQLRKEKCNALLAVAGGSARDARMITLTYKGTDPKAKPVVLVGKTITFDSGGLSLKPGRNMSWMLFDKCGGMAVLAAMQMVARLQPSVPVIGILAAAENMPDGAASRPGDIVRSRAGKTIEILNTDAEGRLALADALHMALKHKPAAIVDLATLTGAAIVALGHHAAALMGNDRNLTQALRQAADAGGERLWEFPLWKEYREDMKGTFADLQNISKSGTAGTITAGAFLSEFVPKHIPWAHIDIAGTAWVETPKPWMDPGATLFGARTLIEWIKGL